MELSLRWPSGPFPKELTLQVRYGLIMRVKRRFVSFGQNIPRAGGIPNVMRGEQNQTTQPLREDAVFQNWDVVAEGWYFACPSGELSPKKPRSLDLCGQHVVLFRGEDGQVCALDGFCPHMGTDLGIGTVKGNRIACFFHHWEFDGSGACQKIPCGEPVPAGGSLQSYAVEEKYDAIWVFPARVASFPVPDFAGLEGRALRVSFGKPYQRTCHHHVTMINGIDAQHLRTVHGFEIEMELTIRETGAGLIDFSLDGKLPDRSLKDRLLIRLLGEDYGYAMRYSAGTMGLLTMMRRVRFLGRFPAPALRMIFAYRPLARGKTLVQPIYVTARRPGLAGGLREWFVLWLTRRLFYSLKDDDGKVYDNMRFNPVSLLEIDEPVRRFIDKVNQLRPSLWSRARRKD